MKQNYVLRVVGRKNFWLYFGIQDYFNYVPVKISHALKVDAKCSLPKSFAKAVVKAVLYSTFLTQIVW